MDLYNISKPNVSLIRAWKKMLTVYHENKNFYMLKPQNYLCDGHTDGHWYVETTVFYKILVHHNNANLVNTNLCYSENNIIFTIERNFLLLFLIFEGLTTIKKYILNA